VSALAIYHSLKVAGIENSTPRLRPQTDRRKRPSGEQPRPEFGDALQPRGICSASPVRAGTEQSKTQN
jgi:hypothetical protein